MALNYREAGRYSGSRIVNRQEGRGARVRQILIELWVMLIVTTVVGFLCPLVTGVLGRAPFQHSLAALWDWAAGVFFQALGGF